ncbi:PHP domain-containing protein, partial [Patescibacteria group bacterium]|nr:PHP domain-containing protein [Patescibacteria group bacterium]
MSLKLRKLDLHVHSPASHDFADKKVTAEQIVEHAQNVGLDAIAITDHNSVDFIDSVKEAAKKKGFVVFPGVEISCGGSKNGSIHVIGLFDPSKTKDDLQKVLGQLGIKGVGEDSLTPKSVSDVIDIIRGA